MSTYWKLRNSGNDEINEEITDRRWEGNAYAICRKKKAITDQYIFFRIHDLRKLLLGGR